MPRQYINSPVPHTCPQCGGEFMAHASANRRYCSHACYSQGKRKAPDGACPICDATFRKAYSGQRYCSTECRDEAQRRRQTRTCPQCQGQFECRPADPTRFCSVRCADAAKPGRMLKLHLYPTGVCERCGKTFQIKRKEASGRYCSRACSDAGNKGKPAQPWIPKLCANCGKEFLCSPWHPHVAHCSGTCAQTNPAVKRRGQADPRWRRKLMACEVCGDRVWVKRAHFDRFRACSRRCAAILGQQIWPRISSIERKMGEAFLALGIAVVPQHTIGPFIVDFAIPCSQIAVECDGVYWHGLPDRIEKDRRKDAYLRGRHWAIVRLGEEEINANPMACARRIEAMLHDAVPSADEAESRTRSDPSPGSG